MTLKNDVKFEKELTCQFKIDMRNLTNFDQLKDLKNLYFNELFLTKVYNVWAKKSVEELCLIALKIDLKSEVKLLVISKITWMAFHFHLQAEK